MSTLTTFRCSSFTASFALALLISTIAPAAAPPQTDLDRAAKLLRRARDTQNPADFRQAGSLATSALAADPKNFDAQRYQAAALLGQQDLPAALDLAAKLNKRVPDDIGIWALLSEIHAARGDYVEAERCAQWVLDLRRNSPLGFSAAARMREIFGDYDGAADFYSEALRRTPQSDLEERSWLLVQNARMLIRTKNLSAAATTLDQAEKLFPNSVQVMEHRASLARINGDYGQAASLLALESQASPTAAHLFAYAQALDRAGSKTEATTVYQKLDSDGTMAGPTLVFYYADRKKDFDKALTLAIGQAALRQDTATLDAYAWALYRSGNFTEARTQIDKLLALGTREPEYVCHAASISSKTGGMNAAAMHIPEGACENTK